jgi:glycosyltransferase involved in cell wall biosynthesis
MANIKRPLKILYLAPYNYTGTLDVLVAEHRRQGYVADFVTLTKSREKFDDGICLDLRPNGNDKAIIKFRNLITENYDLRGLRKDLPGSPPFCNPSTLRKIALKAKDLFYQKRIWQFINKYNLLDYDVYHLESGIDFFSDYRVLPLLKARGKKLIANYHGNDFRNTGVHPVIHRLADVNMTCEWDIYFRYPNCIYEFLPVNTVCSNTVNQNANKVRIIHSTRGSEHMYYKGSHKIIEIATEATKGRNAEFKYITKMSHSEAMTEYSKSHILIDQMGGKGGYGYGMSAVEGLIRGLNVFVEIQKKMEKEIPNHPFVNITEDTLYEKLVEYIDNEELRIKSAANGLKWVTEKHSVACIVKRLHELYDRQFSNY